MRMLRGSLGQQKTPRPVLLAALREADEADKELVAHAAGCFADSSESSSMLRKLT